VASDLRYFLDENLLPIGKALASVRSDVTFPGHPAINDRIPTGTLDPDWLPVVGSRDLDLVVLSHDKGIRNKPAERQAHLDNGVRFIVLTTARDLTMWDKLSLIVKKWEAMEKRIRQAEAGPWMISMAESGFKDIVS